MHRAESTRAEPTSASARLPLAALLALLLAACSSPRPQPADDPPTLALLKSRVVPIAPDPGPPRDEQRTAAAYRAFVAAAPASAPQLATARRRLGDLELELAERQAGDGQGADYRAAIAQYQAWLAADAQAEGRDEVLYQLARAQEQGGDGKGALATLDQLVARHPRSDWRDEAEFRRGELLFSQRRWAEAEAAYTVVLQAGAGSPWRDRALYMQGWSRYRQARWNDALESLFAVLDLSFSARGTAPLSRAETELVDDSLRVVALALEQQQGAAAIEAHVTSERRRGWSWRVYEALAALYEGQGRVRDASDALQRFAQAQPQGAQALPARQRVIELHDRAGFGAAALQARRDFVRAAVDSDDAPMRERLAEHLDLLARHHHAEWQRTRSAAEADAAETWYALAEQQLHDARRGGRRFLRAELLFEAGRHAAARSAYAAAAYGDADHARRADAGHGELLALAQLPDDPAAQRAAAQRFVQRFGSDARALAVRAQLAFDDGDFAAAEAAWAQQLAATDAADAEGRRRIGERLAAAIYRQAEAERSAGRGTRAAALFARVGSELPGSSAAPAALFDAGVQQLALQDWAAAAAALEALRQRHPAHELAARATPQLALAYAEGGRPREAAAELERWAPTLADAAAARQARERAAELYERAAEPARAAVLWQRLAADAAATPQQQVQAHWRLAERARAVGRTRDETQHLRALQQAAARDGGEGGGSEGAARSERTRTLAARAALRLADPLAAAYRQVALVEPLKATLARKKARFDAAQAAFAEAGNGASAEGQAAAAVAGAALYADFGRAVLASPTPRGLRKADAEAYRVLLEEQAFPFEEKAVELYAAVAARTRDGTWDEPVRQAFDALRALRPLRWGKREAGSSPAAARGLAAREAGRFDEAQALYEDALRADPDDTAVRLNLAILLDLYRAEPTLALPHYRALAGRGPAELPRWIAELEARVPRQALARPPEAAR